MLERLRSVSKDKGKDLDDFIRRVVKDYCSEFVNPDNWDYIEEGKEITS